jgi:hypothetical protein
VESEEAVNTPQAWHCDPSIHPAIRIEDSAMPSLVTEPRASGPPLDRLHRYLERLACSDFYGKVIVSFQNGKVHDIKVEQTKKLDEL